MLYLWFARAKVGRRLHQCRLYLRGRWQRRFAQFLLLFLVAAWGGGTIPAGLAQVPSLAESSPLFVGSEASLLDQSRSLYEAGNFEQSARVLQQAIAGYQAQGDTLNQALALRNLALIYQQLGQWSAATDAIATSLNQLATLSNPDRLPILARTLDMQGHLYLNQGQAESALNVWQSAAAIYTQLNDSERLLRNRLSQVQALQSMGMYRRAIHTLADITQALASQPDSEAKAISYQLLGTALQVAGNLDQAETSLQTSLAIAQRLTLSDTIGNTQIALGNTVLAKGNPTAALAYYRQAATQSPNPLIQTRASLSTLSVLIDTQQWSQADALVGQLQQQVNRLPLTQDSIYAKINLADNRLKLAQRQVAPTASMRAGQSGTVTGATLPTTPIVTYTRDNLDLVNLFISRNAPDLSSAASSSREAATPARQSVSSGTYTQDNVDLVETFLGGRIPTTHADEEQKHGQPLPSSVAPAITGNAYTRDNLNLVDLFLGPNTAPNANNTSTISSRSTLGTDTTGITPAPVSNATLAEIAQLLQQAQQDARVLGDFRSEAYALGSLGRVYEQAQQWSDAKALTQKALLISQTINAPEISYRWQWQLGRIYKAESSTKNSRNPDYAQAIAAYSESVNTLQSLRSDLVAINPEIQVAFQESVEPIHRELVSLLLSDSSSLSPDKLEKARNVIESLQLAELDNFFREACLDANPVLIDQVDRQAAVFYPIILPDRLEVIVRLPGQSLRHYSTPVTQAQIESTVTQLRQSLVQKSSQRYLPLTQQVYDWLIRPIASDLSRSGVQTLVFVSDGVLRNVPMAALHDGQQYLMESYAVALTPGLQLLEPSPIARHNLSVLSAGLTEARQGFPALPNVEPEIEEISTKLPSQKVLLNQDFTRDSFAQAIRNLNAPVVHLATHGQFSSNFEETFILTWNDRLSVNQLRELLQTTGLNQATSSVVELLVLSACETAVGDRQAALGLAGTAVRSGARSTLGSLWQVNDEATSILISQFYEQLASGEVTKAEALRRAQQSILEIPRFREHPFFWAPYILVGNWL